MAKANRGGKGARATRKARRSGQPDPSAVRSTVEPFARPAVGALAGTQAPPEPTSAAGKATAKPGSVSEGNRDRQREIQREQNSLSKFPSPQAREAAEKRDRETSTSAGRQSLKGRAKSLDDVQRAEGKVPLAGAVGQIDHAIKNHPREEHDHRVGEPTARIEGPAPRRIADVDDEASILEQLRLETKADNLYLARRQERERPEPREHVINAINARLVEVQGAPILPE